MDEEQKINGATTEELAAEQPAALAELLPAAAEADDIEPYEAATPVVVA